MRRDMTVFPAEVALRAAVSNRDYNAQHSDG